MERDLTLSPSLYGKLSHARNSRPRLPLSSVLQIDRFRGSWHGLSGHLVKGTGPYCGLEEREVEEKLDITRLPEKGCRWRRRRTMGCGERKGKLWIRRANVGPTMTRQHHSVVVTGNGDQTAILPSERLRGVSN